MKEGGFDMILPILTHGSITQKLTTFNEISSFSFGDEEEDNEKAA